MMKDVEKKGIEIVITPSNARECIVKPNETEMINGASRPLQLLKPNNKVLSNTTSCFNLSFHHDGQIHPFKTKKIKVFL